MKPPDHSGPEGLGTGNKVPEGSENAAYENYAAHYDSAVGKRVRRDWDEVQSLRLDRLPRWIDRVHKDARILDAGCATGYLLGLLSAHGYTRLTGVDLSPTLAATARDRLEDSACIVQSDLRDFLRQQADGSFDTVIMHHVLEHIPRDQTIPTLKEIHRCLTPGGFLGIKVPNASFVLGGAMMFGDFTHVTHFNEHSLAQVLAASGYATDRLEIILHPPKLFPPWRHPLHAFLRVLNRLRWHAHRATHHALAMLSDQRPASRAFEAELEMLAQR
jgi:SAM-dependent methyltransferase